MDAIRSSLLLDLLTQRRGTGIGDVVACVGIIGAGSSYTTSMLLPLSSGPMTQVMDPIVKIWPGSRKAMELGKGNHLVGHEFSTHTPYLARHY